MTLVAEYAKTRFYRAPAVAGLGKAADRFRPVTAGTPTTPFSSMAGAAETWASPTGCSNMRTARTTRQPGSRPSSRSSSSSRMPRPRRRACTTATMTSAAADGSPPDSTSRPRASPAGSSATTLSTWPALWNLAGDCDCPRPSSGWPPCASRAISCSARSVAGACSPGLDAARQGAGLAGQRSRSSPRPVDGRGPVHMRLARLAAITGETKYREAAVEIMDAYWREFGQTLAQPFSAPRSTPAPRTKRPDGS